MTEVGSVGTQTDNIPSKNVAIINMDKGSIAKPKRKRPISTIPNAIPDIKQRWRIWEAIDKPNMTRNVEVQEDLSSKLNELFSEKLSGIQEAIASFKSGKIEGQTFSSYSREQEINRGVARGTGSGADTNDWWSKIDWGFAGRQELAQPRSLEEQVREYNKKYNFGSTNEELAQQFASISLKPQQKSTGMVDISVPAKKRRSTTSTDTGDGMSIYGSGVVSSGRRSEEKSLSDVIAEANRQAMLDYMKQDKRYGGAVNKLQDVLQTRRARREYSNMVANERSKNTSGINTDDLTGLMNASINEARARQKASETLGRFGKALGQRQIASGMRNIEKQFRQEDIRRMIERAKRTERGQGIVSLL